MVPIYPSFAFENMDLPPNIIRGDISITDDKNIAIEAAMHGWKVLYIGDPCGEESLINNYGFVVCMPLVPDYNTLVKDVEGYTDEFDLEYIDALGREPALGFFLSILTALYQGINIMMYIPASCRDFRYPKVLMMYFKQQYGIIPNSINGQGGYLTSYNNSNLMFMYSFNTISHIDFLLYYTGTLDNCTIDHLISQIGPKLNNINDYNEKLSAIIDKRQEYIDIVSKGKNPVDVCYHDYSDQLFGGKL